MTMSEDEKYEAQGRAHAALKQARANAATIHTVLREHTANMIATAKSLSSFIESPTLHGHLRDSLKENLRSASSGRIQSLVDDLYEESLKIAELQEHVSRF